MNKKIALIGLIILVVGIVMLVAGSLAIAANSHHSRAYTQYSTGKYISTEITLQQNTTLTIANAMSGMGVVTAADMPTVTSSTLSSVGIQPLASAAGAHVYQLQPGSYYVVYFGSASPSSLYSYVYTSTALSYGLFTTGGIFLAIAGGIVGIIGVVIKPRQQRPTA